MPKRIGTTKADVIAEIMSELDDVISNSLTRSTINHIHHERSVRRKSAELDLRYGWDEGSLRQKQHELQMHNNLVYRGLR